MRGRPNHLLPLELALIDVGLSFRAEGSSSFHGFRAALRLREESGSGLFVTHGALYKALDRLERRGYLVSRWEDAEVALGEGRPRRRLYEVTSAGETAVAQQRVKPATQLGSAPA